MTSLERWARQRLPAGTRKNAERTRTRHSGAVPIGCQSPPPQGSPLETLTEYEQADPLTLISRLDQWYADNTEDSGVRPVVGHGDPEPELIVIGRAPGHAECRAGKAFAGGAAAVVNRLLWHQGYRLRAGGGAYATNASIFFSPSGEEPTTEALATSRPVLKALLKAMRPRYIVGCGRQAARLVLGARCAGIEVLRGQWHEAQAEMVPWRSTMWPVQVRVTYHPLFVIRDEQRRIVKARADFDAIGYQRRACEREDEENRGTYIDDSPATR